MMSSVKSININSPQINPRQAQSAENYGCVKPYKAKKPITFGYRQEDNTGAFQNIKNTLAVLTNDLIGLVGVNAALWYLQGFVNGKILVGKINKHFTKNITEKDSKKLVDLAQEMVNEKPNNGLNNLGFVPGKLGEAYYTHRENVVVVGKDNISSLFHEIGHAMIENKTKFLKKLQRSRGNYTALSLILYTLISQRRANNDYYEDKKAGLFTKVKNFISNNDYVIPLLAFSPELITEGMASHYGLKFLRGKVKEKAIAQSLFNNIKKSYITCFSTY